ncbi:MAG: XdhC family protein [Pseudomonadota bacterium]|nr:XdhC family protein [Pseudomonadota bacterium]
MDSIDLEVLRSASRWLAGGQRATLVTITRTWGSSPRPVGAMLVLREDGLVVGSVSGGCIEDDLIQRARAHNLQGTLPEVLTYGVSAEEARRFGLPCGGTIQVVVEPLGAVSGIDALLAGVESGRLMARQLELRDGSTTVREAQPGDGLSFDGERLVNVHGPRYRLLIIGAGQLSKFVTQIAIGLDYQVTVCDPREEYVGEWQGDGARLLRDMPDDAVIAMRPDARMAVIALSHDPKLDDLALMEALRSPAFYVGAIGSRANNQKRRDRLREFDLGDAELARLHGPIGIHIGSKTPAEIAISILAEITAAKNGVALPDGVRIEVAKRDAVAPGCAIA